MGSAEPALAFATRTFEPPALEIRVNFGLFAGREATPAEIDVLAASSARQGDGARDRLRGKARDQRALGGPVHQVRIEVGGDRATASTTTSSTSCGVGWSRLPSAGRGPVHRDRRIESATPKPSHRPLTRRAYARLHDPFTRSRRRSPRPRGLWWRRVAERVIELVEPAPGHEADELDPADFTTNIDNPNATWGSAAGIFFAGVYLAYGYIRTRQLWACPILLHIG